jgi:hypothetical protein
MNDTPDFVGERFHLDASGDVFHTRIDARADAHGFFGIVPPNSAVSEILIGEVSATELRDRLNAYLGDKAANSLAMHRWVAAYLKGRHPSVYNEALEAYIESPEVKGALARPPSRPVLGYIL